MVRLLITTVVMGISARTAVSISVPGDYADMARAMGANGIRIEAPGEIAPALVDARRANEEGQVAVIEVMTRQYTHFSQYPSLLR